MRKFEMTRKRGIEPDDGHIGSKHVVHVNRQWTFIVESDVKKNQELKTLT